MLPGRASLNIVHRSVAYFTFCPRLSVARSRKLLTVREGVLDLTGMYDHYRPPAGRVRESSVTT